MSEKPEAPWPEVLWLADNLEDCGVGPGAEALRMDAAAELRRLHAEVEALRADAGRYRWLRERYPILTRQEPAQALGLDLRSVYVTTVEKFDATIDAAMEQQRPNAGAEYLRQEVRKEMAEFATPTDVLGRLREEQTK